MKYRSPYQVENSNEYAPSKPKSFYSLQVKTVEKTIRGVFTNELILKGSTVLRDGGCIVTSTNDVFPDKPYAVLVDENLFLVPDDYDSLHESCFLNHSCESNLARIGGLVYIAKRDILPGEELTVDYAPLIADHPLRFWSMKCECESTTCRKIITSNDWQSKILAITLWAEWLPHIQKKIADGLGK